MASTNRTANLHLNQWVGTDKPKMEDFNADNYKIDAALSAHIGNAAMHVSAQERASWSAGAPVVGTYTGNGQEERLIDLGFAPSFGIVFAPERNPVQAVGGTGDMLVYSAFVSKHGCSQAAFIESNGFTVLSTSEAIKNCIPKLNENGMPYIYMVFR